MAWERCPFLPQPPQIAANVANVLYRGLVTHTSASLAWTLAYSRRLSRVIVRSLFWCGKTEKSS